MKQSSLHLYSVKQISPFPELFQKSPRFKSVFSKWSLVVRYQPLKGHFHFEFGLASLKKILHGTKPVKFFRRLKVFSFEMRIAFFSIIERFRYFGIGISFNLRDDDGDGVDDDAYDNDDDDDDDDDDLTILFRFHYRSAGISGTC